MKVTYSIDEQILESFNEICKKEGYNKSKVIAKLITEFTKDKNEQ